MEMPSMKRATQLIAAVLLGSAMGLPARASALANPNEMLTYMPTELVHSRQTASQLNEYLSELSSYDIGGALLQMPKFKRSGKVKLPPTNREMLAFWASHAAAYNAEHATHITVTAVFNGALGKKGPNLEAPSTRANMVAAVESVLTTGVSGVQFDIEPFAETPGFTELLEQLDALFTRVGFGGRFSVVAPAETSTWKPAYLLRVSQLVAQVDPTYYESELTTPAAYEEWVKGSLAYYTANVSSGARIVPVLPSYRSNTWHSASVENIATGTAAIEAALAAGSRVNGAGIWWWYGFYDDEGGRYGESYASADRAAWLTGTVDAPFSP